jgi:hypothetical protein
MNNLKKSPKIPGKREGKQTFFCEQTRPAILKSPILQSKNNRCVTCVTWCMNSIWPTSIKNDTENV